MKKSPITRNGDWGLTAFFAVLSMSVLLLVADAAHGESAIAIGVVAVHKLIGEYECTCIGVEDTWSITTPEASRVIEI